MANQAPKKTETQQKHEQIRVEFQRLRDKMPIGRAIDMLSDKYEMSFPYVYTLVMTRVKNSL